MMDYAFIKHNDEDFGLKEDLFGSHTNNYKCEGAPEVMDENWSTSTDLDSIFPMDFLNNLNYQQGSFGTLDDLTEHIKMEAEDYEISVPSLPEPLLLSAESNNISSNSSDSGLSSDNLEVEMSPKYEPLSPASPNLSRSEKNINKSPAEIKSVELLQLPTKRLCSNEQKPKVIVQKLPQVMTLTNTVQTNVTTIKPQKQQYHEQQHHRQSAQQTKLLNGVRGSEIKIVKLSPQMFTASNNKPVTIQVKNSNSGAKIQAKPGTLFLNKAKLTEMKKIVRVQNSNPRSVLIPVSLQDVKELKTFKIVNTTAVRSTSVKKNESTDSSNRNFQMKHIGSPNIFQTIDIKTDEKDDDFIEQSSDSESIIIEDGYDNDDDYVHDPEAPYPKLVLTSEEKRLLSKEGITLPTHYPLTKHEERELKRIRRKIRNKISAQDSRKRKKEYVDGLEERVKQCTEENQTLMKRIKQLQNQNQNLMSQMKKLQNLLTKGTNKTTQPTTCLMVLLLSLALVAAPNLKLGQNAKEGDLEEAVQETILQNRRNLLFNTKDHNTDIFDEDVNMSDILSTVDLNNECESNAVCKTNSNTYTTTSSLGEPKCKKVKLTHSEFIDDIDEENWYLSKSNQAKFNTVNALEFQQNSREHLQTSGFNIEKETKVVATDNSGENSWLDKDILEMVSPTFNGLYELNMDKITTAVTYASSPEASMIDVPVKQMYTNQINIKQNSSEMRQINKY